MSLPSPAARFVLATVVFSWSCWLLGAWLRDLAFTVRVGDSRFQLPYYHLLVWIGLFGPGFVALFMAEEREGPESLWARLTNCRVGETWYSLAVFLPVAITFVALMGYQVLGGTMYTGTPAVYWLLFLLQHTVLGPFWEELGWRGYLLPTLLETRTPLRASLLVGLVWGPWHFVLRWNEWSGPIYRLLAFFVVFCIMAAGLSVIFTWIFLKTRGAILPAVVLHASFNTSVGFLLGPSIAVQGMGPTLCLVVAVWLAALLVWLLGGLRRPDEAAPLLVASP